MDAARQCAGLRPSDAEAGHPEGGARRRRADPAPGDGDGPRGLGEAAASLRGADGGGELHGGQRRGPRPSPDAAQAGRGGRGPSPRPRHRGQPRPHPLRGLRLQLLFPPARPRRHARGQGARVGPHRPQPGQLWRAQVRQGRARGRARRPGSAGGARGLGAAHLPARAPVRQRPAWRRRQSGRGAGGLARPVGKARLGPR